MLGVGNRHLDDRYARTADDTIAPARSLGRPGPALVLWTSALAVLAVSAAASVWLGIQIAFFVRDPVTTLNGHPLTGVLSNVGVLLWCTAAAICFFASAVLRGRRSALAAFFVWSAIVTTVLLLDDFFLFHDDLARRIFGLKQRHVELAYLVGVVGYLLAFRRVLFESDWGLLFVALALFAVSMGVDQIQHRWPSPWRIGVEDGAKFLGIVGWMGFFVQTAFRAIVATDEHQRR
jgi:hypothetical protein